MIYYGLKYIQPEGIGSDNLVKTDRGYEAWTNRTVSDFDSTNPPYYTNDINIAFRDLEHIKQQPFNDLWYVIVESFER